MLDNNVIDNAVGKKFSEFSDAIKAELKGKLSNHEVIDNYVKEYDSIQAKKQAFSDINNMNSEE